MINVDLDFAVSVRYYIICLLLVSRFEFYYSSYYMVFHYFYLRSTIGLLLRVVISFRVKVNISYSFFKAKSANVSTLIVSTFRCFIYGLGGGRTKSL